MYKFIVFTLFKLMYSFGNPAYQFDPRIHTLGNFGLGGHVHAAIAPFCTWVIDQAAYSGTDLRTLVKNEYAAQTGTLDLCSGTGYSSTDFGISVDTSKPMLRMARLLHSKTRSVVLANAEDVYIPRDIVTCMFGLHEIPREGRFKVIRNAIKNSNKRTVFVDIHETYKPSKHMLMGEPYLFDYLSNTKIDMVGICLELNKKLKYEEIIPGHVQAWIIEN